MFFFSHFTTTLQEIRQKIALRYGINMVVVPLNIQKLADQKKRKAIKITTLYGI